MARVRTIGELPKDHPVRDWLRKYPGLGIVVMSSRMLPEGLLEKVLEARREYDGGVKRLVVQWRACW